MLTKVLSVIMIFALSLLLVLAPVNNIFAAPNSNASDKAKAVKTEKAKEKIKSEFKNFDKAIEKSNNSNKQFGKNAATNSGLYSSNIDEVVDELGEVVDEESEEGDEEAAEDVEEVIEEQEETVGEVVEAIEKVESRNKFKTALIGTDYKNLGALRSHLVRNRNQIRKLTKAAVTLETTDPCGPVSGQLTTLMQERERIKTVIEEGESTFSILGWVSKFLSGYTEEPIEDEDLEEEVGETIAEIDEGEDCEGDDPDGEGEDPEPTGSPEPTESPTASPTGSPEPTDSPEPTTEPTDSPTTSPEVTI